ncbi:MAG: hypothetical protein QM784_09345 [Polyangiaceae bacterium]
MTDHQRFDGDDVERKLQRRVTEALVKNQELVPLTEAEVALAEARGVAFEGDLPDGLKHFAPRADVSPKNVVALETRRARNRSWVGYALSFGLGAAAAASVMWYAQREASSSRIVVAKEPLDPLQAKPVLPAGGHPGTIGPLATCPDSCCAGTDCAAAKSPLRECASLRRCIRCDAGATASRFRIRVGRLAPSETTRFLLDKSPGRALEICVRAGSSELFCTPAQANAPEEEAWASLPLVASPADLLAGLTVQVRWVGDTDPVAVWAKPVDSNPTVLCSGIAAKPTLPDGEPIGSLSIFLDDPYYVELGRAGSTQALLSATNQLKFSGVAPLLYQTTATGNERFAISLGPYDKLTAESLRWATLNQGGEAKIVLGFDYRGTAARPALP